jgi:hypothetical protein
MPAVSPQAFISVEASLTTRLWSTFLALHEETLSAMDKAARHEQWDVLSNLIDDIDLEGVYDLNRDYIRYLSNVAMLFGASLASGRRKSTHVALGFDSETVQQVMESFRTMLITTGVENIQKQARTYAGFLSTEKSDEGMYLGLVHKFHNVGFNEDAHPRVPAGSSEGGEFAPKAGYPMRLSSLDSLPKTPKIEEAHVASVMQAPAGTPEFGTPTKGAVQVLGYHFSTQALKNVMGYYHGRGLKDAADERLSEPGTDSRIKNRIYFYVDEGHGIVPEAGVGGYKHAVLLKNLYDPQMDHGQLWAKGKGNANVSEKAVLDAGYDGYYVRNFANRAGVAVVLGDKTVPVKQIVTKDDISGGDLAASGGMKTPDSGMPSKYLMAMRPVKKPKKRKDPAKHLTLQLKAQAPDHALVFKFNPNHDELGRFADRNTDLVDVYHGTAQSYLDSILKDGLTATKDHRNYSKKTGFVDEAEYYKGDRKESIFITPNRARAVFYAENAAKNLPAEKGAGKAMFLFGDKSKPMGRADLYHGVVLHFKLPLDVAKQFKPDDKDPKGFYAPIKLDPKYLVDYDTYKIDTSTTTPRKDKHVDVQKDEGEDLYVFIPIIEVPEIRKADLEDSSIQQGGDEAPDPLKKKKKPAYSEGRDAATPPGLIGPAGVPGALTILPMSTGALKADLPPVPDAPSVLPFSSFVDGASKAFFNIASSLHTSRLSAFGYTAEARYLGITRYQVDEQLDSRTCEVCQIMNGKSFNVSDARNFLDVVVRTEDADELRQLQPWPKQNKDAIEALRGMSEDELVSQGWHVPPYHPRCRGLLSKATVQVPATPAEQAAIPTTDLLPSQRPFSATLEDFKALGVTMTPEKVDEWNNLIGESPANLLALLQDRSEADIIEEAQTASEDQHQELIRDALGLEDMVVDSYGAVRIALRRVSRFHGGNQIDATMDLYYNPDRNLFISSVNLTNGPEAEIAYFLRSMLRDTYRSALASDFHSMSMTAGADLSGYALAKYGFATSEDAWGALKTQIAKTLRTSAVSSMITADEQLVLDHILASDDPKDAFLLADLPNVGEALLAGTHYLGYLDLSDPESVARFLAYMYETGRGEASQ